MMVNILLFPFLVLHIVLLSRITFTAWPEMLCYPYLLSNGFVWYRDFIMPYPPGLIYPLKLFFDFFGYEVVNLKVFTWGLILLTDLFLYWVLRVVSKNTAISLFGLFAYILIQPFLDGNMLWFDFATVLPLLLVFLFVCKWIEKKGMLNLYLVGVFLAVSILVKQVSLVYLLLLLGFYIWIKKRADAKDIGIVALGFLMPMLPFLAYLFVSNTFWDFWNWNVYYPLNFWPDFPGYVEFSLSKSQILVLLLLGLPVLFSGLRFKEFVNNWFFRLAVLFLIGALIAVYPRFSYFHLQGAIAFVVVLIAVIAKNLSKNTKFALAAFCIICSLGIVFLNTRFRNTEDYRFYTDEDVKMAQYIEKKVGKGNHVFLLGGYCSLYVFSNTLPPKYWGDNFGWYFEIDGVQEKFILGIKNDKPRYIFRSKAMDGDWFRIGIYQPKKVVEYINKEYKKIEELDNSIEIWEKR